MPLDNAQHRGDIGADHRCSIGARADHVCMLGTPTGVRVPDVRPQCREWQPAPELDVTRVTTRQFTYLQNCATCHQPNLSGTDNWKIRNENGRLKPPPLDSAGHVWRHSDSLLIEVVTDGSFDPDSNMKGFTDWLSDSEIADVIEFLRSTWGPEDGSFQWSSTWQASQL